MKNNDDFYCQECYKIEFGPKCSCGCGNSIEANFVTF